MGEVSKVGRTFADVIWSCNGSKFPETNRSKWKSCSSLRLCVPFRVKCGIWRKGSSSHVIKTAIFIQQNNKVSQQNRSVLLQNNSVLFQRRSVLLQNNSVSSQNNSVLLQRRSVWVKTTTFRSKAEVFSYKTIVSWNKTKVLCRRIKMFCYKAKVFCFITTVFCPKEEVFCHGTKVFCHKTFLSWALNGAKMVKNGVWRRNYQLSPPKGATGREQALLFPPADLTKYTFSWCVHIQVNGRMSEWW